MIVISLNDPTNGEAPPTLKDCRTEFYSSNGIYLVDNMTIITRPAVANLTMTVRADQSAIQTSPFPPYDLKFKLEVRGCILGEQQIKTPDQNYIC